MNLWAKRTGLVLTAAALFLLSCEDDSFLLGIKGKTKFQGVYHEIVFDGEKSSVLLLDSVYTDQYQYAVAASPINPFAYRFLIGSYLDPLFGTVSAGFYVQYLPNVPTYFNSDDENPANFVLDSTTIQLVLDFYAYGPEVTIDDIIDVYPLIETPEDENNPLNFYTRYITSSTLTYGPTPIAQLRVKKFSRTYPGSSKFRPYPLTQTLYEEQTDRSPANRDTIMLQGRVEPEFGFHIFDWIASQGDTALVSDDLVEEFRKKFPGLALVSTRTGRVIGINPLNGFSRFTFHYQNKNVTKDSLTTFLYFTPFPYVEAAGFTSITTTRNGELSGIGTEPNVPYNPGSERRYIQDGSAVITELDLSDYYSFIDTLENIVINSAELSIPLETPVANMAPPSELYAMLMKKTPDGKIIPLDMLEDQDSLLWRNYLGTAFTDTFNFAIASESSSISPLVLSYDNVKNSYNGYATLFFQSLFNSKGKPQFKVEHLGFYPATAPILKMITNFQGSQTTVPLLKSGTGNSVNRAVLKANGIKLKLYYTKPNKPNLE